MNKANSMDVVIDLISLSSIHNSFLRINPIPWIVWLILSPSPLSIKACPFAFGKLVLVIVRIPRVQEIEAARAFFAPIRPNLSEEILVTKEREACFPSQQALQDMCCWSPIQRRIWRQNYGCILLCCLSIIDDYHYGSTLIVLCNDWCWVISFLTDI